MSFLPFFNLSDLEFNHLINTNVVDQDNNVLRVPLDQLRLMKLDIIDCRNDRFTVDDNLELLSTDLYSKILQNSDYFFDDIPGHEADSFSIFSHNINSLPKHYDELITLLETELKSRFDVIALCECKLTNDISNLYNITGYSMFTNNSSRNSGGLTLYIDSIHDKCFVRNDLNLNCIDTESLFIEILCKEKNIVIGVVYRRPGTGFDNFYTKVSNIVDSLRLENKVIYITGDFNVDLLKFRESNDATNLLTLFTANNFVCTIAHPTRVTATTATLIDHLWTNNGINLINNGIIYSDISDHFPVFSKFSYKSKSNSKQDVVIEYRKISDSNIENFKNDLLDVHWDLILNTNNVEVAYSNFMLVFKSHFFKHFPLIVKTVNSKSINKQFITEDIKKLIKEKNKTAKSYSKHPITYGEKYRKLRNKVTNEIRKAKRIYFNNKFEQSAGNPKKTWSVINEALKRKNKNKICYEFLIDNNLISDSDIIVDKFNEYFSNIGTELANRLLLSHVDFRSFLGPRNQI